MNNIKQWNEVLIENEINSDGTKKTIENVSYDKDGVKHIKLDKTFYYIWIEQNKNFIDKIENAAINNILSNSNIRTRVYSFVASKCRKNVSTYHDKLTSMKLAMKSILSVDNNSENGTYIYQIIMSVMTKHYLFTVDINDKYFDDFMDIYLKPYLSHE